MDIFSHAGNRTMIVTPMLVRLNARRNEPMRLHTSFRIGGEAALYIAAHNESELVMSVNECKRLNLPYLLIGNGSNLLVSDYGVDAVVIQLAGNGEYRIDGNRMTCSADMSFTQAAVIAAENGLMGLEWAYGIPGTVGGAVAMNAGAYGGEIKNVLRSVRFFENGCVRDITVSPDDLGYRYSAYTFPRGIVLGAEFELMPDDGNAKERMQSYLTARKAKQPLKYPSAGSVFKRPKNAYAGELIQNAGLKGFSVGDAQVSELHAGFIINTGNATANDVICLIDTIKKRVFELSGIMLEEELKMIGNFGGDVLCNY